MSGRDILERLRPDGLTEAEGAAMDALVEATNGYAALEVEHPSEPGEFIAAVHRAQDLLAVRVARREYPAGWSRFSCRVEWEVSGGAVQE